MESVSLHSVVIGAGVIGMAIARELAGRGVEVAVLEADAFIGAGVSSRNSGVIHAGLYYKPGSLKARFCVAGRDLLYAYAASRGIWHERCGKLVVATEPEQVEPLRALKRNAEANGVTDMTLLAAVAARALEPEIACREALHVPASGMIDVHGLLEEFRRDAEGNGAIIQCNSKCLGAKPRQGGFTVRVAGPDGEYQIHCRHLINAAGLQAQDVAGLIDGFDAALIPEQILGKGSYFFLEGQKPPFSRLVYPMPMPGTSGLHCRRDVNGRCVLGPDLEIVAAPDYRVDSARADYFYDHVRRYFPALRRDSLCPDYAGIRPKLKHGHDFVLQYEQTHRMPGLVNCFGIESPGLTSCMALAKAVADRLG